MKKLLLILLCLTACTKTTVPLLLVDIFTLPQTAVSNAGQISFKLNTNGYYTLTMMDTANNVLTREKINGKIGFNTLSIYTRSIPSTYLYLILSDSVGNQLGKTILTIN
jgi:hypothetical protein